MALSLSATARPWGGLRSDHRHPEVESKYLLPSLHCRSVLPCSSAINPRVCGLKIWILQRLEHLKSIRKHGWQKKPEKLEIIGKDRETGHLENSSSSDGKPIEDVQLLNGQLHYQPVSNYFADSAEQTVLSNSQSKGSFPSNHQLTVSKDPPFPKGSPLSVVETNPKVYSSLGDRTPSLCIAVIGATGELARNKVFPALFALYYSGFLPKNVRIFGYSRKQLTDEDLRTIIVGTLTCRVDHHENCGEKLDAFLSKIFHINGGYNNRDGMTKLNCLMEEIEGDSEANRIFYLSVPQEALLDVALSLADNAQSKRGWNRIIIEKPFGLDVISSSQLTRFLLSKFEEKQIYRIDHLLGKDLIENLTVLRFSNLVFEPLWSRTYIRSVQLILSEECGIESRGRYFGGYGIIRDVVHSHILQSLALFAMEPPVSLDGEDIRNEKVKVLRSIRQLQLDDVVLGQHKVNSSEKVNTCMDSLTPTFFAAALYIDSARWDGVPFLIRTGLGLIKHRVEIRIQFHNVPGNIYRERIGHNIALSTNELILRDMPDEAILMKVNNKVPGLGLQLDASELNLLYKDKYNVDIPDSYEHLLLDVIDGDNHLFMRSDELEAAWNILTPVLREIDENKIIPELYEFGGRGPVGAYYLDAKHGVRWADD